jgi:HEAT repeat protein
MKTLHGICIGITLFGTLQAQAQGVPPETREYSRKGEVSPGAQAPTPAAMVAAIQQGAPEKLKATLEYGERVMCVQCVPLLEANLLASGDARVRELSAWWLRRQPFAAPAMLKKLRAVLRDDADVTRRARAAEALGEFMDPHALPELSNAAKADAAPAVRVQAVRALARLNDQRGSATIASALSDTSPEVRAAALDVVIIVSSFRDYAALLPLLADADERLRAHAARLCGEFRVAAAEPTLSTMLAGDASPHARKAAAWALGRIGGALGRTALLEQKARERDGLVLSAIDVAERMPSRAP